MSPGCVPQSDICLLEAPRGKVFAHEAPMPTPPAPRVHTSPGSSRPPRRNIPHRHRCGSTPRSPGCVFGTGSRRPAPPYAAVVVHEPCRGHARVVGPSLALTSASPSKLSGNTADTHVCDSSPTSPGCVFWSKIRLPEAAYGDVFCARHDASTPPIALADTLLIARAAAPAPPRLSFMPAPDLPRFPSSSGVRQPTSYPTGSCKCPVSHNTPPRSTCTRSTCTCTARGGPSLKLLYLVRNFESDAQKKMGESPIVGGWTYVVEL